MVYVRVICSMCVLLTVLNRAILYVELTGCTLQWNSGEEVQCHIVDIHSRCVAVKPNLEN